MSMQTDSAKIDVRYSSVIYRYSTWVFMAFPGHGISRSRQHRQYDTRKSGWGGGGMGGLRFVK